MRFPSTAILAVLCLKVAPSAGFTVTTKHAGWVRSVQGRLYAKPSKQDGEPNSEPEDSSLEPSEPLVTSSSDMFDNYEPMEVLSPLVEPRVRSEPSTPPSAPKNKGKTGNGVDFASSGQDYSSLVFSDDKEGGVPDDEVFMNLGAKIMDEPTEPYGDPYKESYDDPFRSQSPFDDPFQAQYDEPVETPFDDPEFDPFLNLGGDADPFLNLAGDADNSDLYEPKESSDNDGDSKDDKQDDIPRYEADEGDFVPMLYKDPFSGDTVTYNVTLDKKPTGTGFPRDRFSRRAFEDDELSPDEQIVDSLVDRFRDWDPDEIEETLSLHERLLLKNATRNQRNAPRSPLRMTDTYPEADFDGYDDNGVNMVSTPDVLSPDVVGNRGFFGDNENFSLYEKMKQQNMMNDNNMKRADGPSRMLNDDPASGGKKKNGGESKDDDKNFFPEEKTPFFVEEDHVYIDVPGEKTVNVAGPPDVFDPLVSPHAYPEGVPDIVGEAFDWDGVPKVIGDDLEKSASVEESDNLDKSASVKEIPTKSSTPDVVATPDVFDPLLSPHAYPKGTPDVIGDAFGDSKKSSKSVSSVGILLMDHGSKKKESNDRLHELARQYQKTVGADVCVRAAHMEIASPSIEEGLKQLLDEGVDEIICHPYFLSPYGRHVSEDIPQIVSEAIESLNATIPITTTEPVGANNDVMISAIQTIVNRSRKRQ